MAQERADAQCDKLRRAFAEEKAAILDALAQASQQDKVRTEATVDVELDVVLTASTGPYAGRKWTLKPRRGKAALKLGRSTGKGFTVSLPEDSEVSTTHGKVSEGGGRAGQRGQRA